MNIDEVMKGIRDNEDLLEEQIQNGDNTANKVGMLYNIVHAFPYERNITLFIGAYEDWCKENSISA